MALQIALLVAAAHYWPAAAAITAGAPHHLTIMSSYGFDPEIMHSWANLMPYGPLQLQLDTWSQYGIPSLYGPEGGLPAAHGGSCASSPSAVFLRGKGLCPGWESSLEALAKKDILPNLGKNRALRGVFFGDEICCSNITCWTDALAPVAKKLRALLGPDAILYTNECAEKDIPEVPPDFDLISVDTYAAYAPGTNGTDEVVRAKAEFAKIFPKLHSHQQVVLVPGTFGCSNLSYFPAAGQAKNLVDKLDGYFEWAKQDTRIAGFNGWHFTNRTKPQHGPPCDMELGAVAFPSVVAKMREIGKFITGGIRI